MADVVVTVPQGLWDDWLREGDLPGETWSGAESHFNLGGDPPDTKPGERVYVVAFGRVRGYAPLRRIDRGQTWGEWRPGGFALVRRGGAVACTIPEGVRGFRGWRYRWWPREQEIPFPDWRTAGVPAPPAPAAGQKWSGGG